MPIDRRKHVLRNHAYSQYNNDTCTVKYNLQIYNKCVFIKLTEYWIRKYSGIIMICILFTIFFHVIKNSNRYQIHQYLNNSRLCCMKYLENDTISLGAFNWTIEMRRASVYTVIMLRVYHINLGCPVSGIRQVYFLGVVYATILCYVWFKMLAKGSSKVIWGYLMYTFTEKTSLTD